jgi:hypothetical protein
MILNHRLQLISILPSLIWVNSQLHLSLWGSSFIIVPFKKNPQSIFHAIPLLMVETTYALEVFPLFLKLVYPTTDFDMGFL